MIWLILDITGSSIATGLVAMSAYLPAMLLGLFAGVLSDRYSRMGLMISSNLSQALTVIIIPILLYYHYSNVLVIGLLAFVRASFSTLFPPAFNAFIPTIVGKQHLVRVNSIFSTSAQLAYLIGPATAGILLGIISLPYLFVIDSSSFVVAVLIFGFVIKPPGAPKSSPEKHSNLQQLRKGLSFVFSNPGLKQLMVLTSINNIFIMGPAIVGTPILVRNALNGTASQYAFVESGLALGMLLGTALVYKHGHRLNSGRLLLLGMIIDGLTYSLFYFAGSVNFVMVFIIIHALGIPFITVSRTTIIQRHSPNHYHGRLFSMVHLSVVGITALSSALTGILASIMDIRVIFLFIGLAAASCGIVGFFKLELKSMT
jgi:MFS family permease